MNASSSNKNIVKQRPTLKYISCGGADKAPHAHTHPEFIFVADGSGRFEAQGNQYPIKTGDFIICSHGVEHSEYLFDTPDSSMFHVGLEGAVVFGHEKNSVIDDPFLIIHTNGSDFEIIKAYFKALYEEHTDPKLSSELIESDLLRLLLIYSLRLAVTDEGMLLIRNKQFYEAKRYFDKNFMTITNIEDVCNLLHINKFYLTHIFKEQLGIPPIRYLQSKKIEKAKALLASGVPISETASKCGYNDTAYFCRVFKKIVGVSPLQYRVQSKHRELHE